MLQLVLQADPPRLQVEHYEIFQVNSKYLPAKYEITREERKANSQFAVK